MDLLKLLYFLALVSVGAVAEHGDLGVSWRTRLPNTPTPNLEVYWRTRLPNTPMPKAVSDIVHNGKSPGVGSFALDGRGDSNRKYQQIKYRNTGDSSPTEDQKVKVYFFKKDIRRGSSVNVQFIEPRNDIPGFVPRQVADSTPFSSKSVPEILNKFSVNPHSAQAEAIKETIAECEEPALEGEDKYCATSLESMVDFTTSRLGRNVLAVSSEAPKNDGKLQKYGIVDVSKLNNDKAVVDDKLVACHRQDYAYAVFYCHSFPKTDAYLVNLVGADGAKVKAVVVCHRDTSSWDPRHLAFQQLKVKPGTVPICHFFYGVHIVWVPKH